MPSTRNGGPHPPSSGAGVGQQETPTKEEKETKVDEDESSASDEDSFSCECFKKTTPNCKQKPNTSSINTFFLRCSFYVIYECDLCRYLSF